MEDLFFIKEFLPEDFSEIWNILQGNDAFFFFLRIYD